MEVFGWMGQKVGLDPGLRRLLVVVVGLVRCFVSLTRGRHLFSSVLLEPRRVGGSVGSYI